MPAPKLNTITVDVPPPHPIATAPDIEPVDVEDALYNIAAIPAGGLSVEATGSASPTDTIAATSEAATTELEGPALAWIGNPGHASAGNDGATRPNTDPQTVTDAAEGPTDYYRAALRLSEPRSGARTVQSSPQAPVEDQHGCAPLPETGLNPDVVEGPAQDWLHYPAAMSRTNDAGVTGENVATALEPVMLEQPAATVVDLETDAVLVVASDSGTRPQSWTLAASLEPCTRPQPATPDTAGDDAFVPDDTRNIPEDIAG